MAPMNGEDELAKLRTEMSELRKSFNLFVRAQASLVMALRQAEEADQQRHRHLLNTINGLRSLALSESQEHEERSLVVVTDSHGAHAGHIKPKGEVSGSFKVGGISVQLDGEDRDFRNLAFKVGRWLLVILGMLATGGVGWLIGFVKRLGEGGGK